MLNIPIHDEFIYDGKILLSSNYQNIHRFPVHQANKKYAEK